MRREKESYDWFFESDNGNIGYTALRGFSQMPKQAQTLLMDALMFGILQGDYQCITLQTLAAEKCNSPIEYTYFIALMIAASAREDELVIYCDDYISKSADICATPQYKIETEDHIYYADFLLDISYFGGDMIELSSAQSIVIECDGFEYHHATKEQVNHDNERELAIKKAGYDVLRFSGSQIYNDPFKCANDTIDYIIAEMNRRCCEEAV